MDLANNIVFEDVKQNERLYYQLYSITGQLYFRGLLRAGTNVISTNIIPTGLFFISVGASETERQVFKLLKTR